MLKIRLTRMGAKKNPFYRIVVIDSREARNGAPTDTIGWYDPAKLDAPVKIDEEKVRAAAAVGHHWKNPVWRDEIGTVLEW
jgi:ribosomal protein S16